MTGNPQIIKQLTGITTMNKAHIQQGPQFRGLQLDSRAQNIFFARPNRYDPLTLY